MEEKELIHKAVKLYLADWASKYAATASINAVWPAATAAMTQICAVRPPEPEVADMEETEIYAVQSR